MSTKELGDLSPTNFEKRRKGKRDINGENNSKLVGDEGERIACEYLVENGFNIVARNYRIMFGKKVFGEIDIVAKKPWRPFRNDKTIRFVEVKTLRLASLFQGRPAEEIFFPEQKVDFRKQNKLKRICQIWLDQNHFSQYHPHQIDIVGILLDGLTNKPIISHFENVVEG